jgi:adenylate cyclase
VTSAVIERLNRIGADPSDDGEIRVQKRLLVAVSTMIATLALFWGLTYLIYDEPLAATIPWTYSIAVFVSLTIFGLTKRFRLFRTTQLALILVLPFLLQIVLGGFVDASAVILWSLMAPLGALGIAGRRQAIGWFAAYVALVVISLAIQPGLGRTNNLTDGLVAAFFVLNILGSTGVSFVAMSFFVSLKDETLELLDEEKAKSERLLLNVLPRSIAEILREREQTIANGFANVSVLFADLVDFTPISERLSPEELVEMLNEVFSHFDALVDGRGLEKIRTVGDSYMVASGVPDPRPDHAHSIAHLALEIVGFVGEYQAPEGGKLGIRVGISSGPAVAGVIGKAKFQYDIWGDTVNTASRMESHGIPGRIQVSSSTHQLLETDFDFESRGVIDVKGKGPMETWFLVGARHPGSGVMSAPRASGEAPVSG